MNSTHEYSVLNAQLLSELSDAELQEYYQLLSARETQQRRNRIDDYYPATGPLRRELYKKHTEFFSLGKDHKQRLALCANRVGKSEGMGAYEIACHCTGQYPQWWVGHRYSSPPKTVWIAGKTASDVRNSIQEKLLGPINDIGTGMIRHSQIIATTAKTGVPSAIDSVRVRWKSDPQRQSLIVFKSYDQGRESFQAADVDLLWLDEEPPLEVYIEAVTRTMTTNGLVILTFTPLLGLSDTVMQWLPAGEVKELRDETRAIVTCTWDDVPHLTAQQKKEMLATYPPWQQDARTKGIPQLGAGAIYPVPESDFVIDAIPIPDHWPRVYALDVGWNKTAALWGAYDRETSTWYIYSEHYRGQAEPSVHAASIRSRGEWIAGVIDPASRGRGQADGKQLLGIYRDLGLSLSEADNGVESGIFATYERLSAGKIKVFRTCQSLLGEYRLYRRDEKGKIVKANDHLVDCLHPDTQVITSVGIRSLVDLVGKTGSVLSIDGQWRRFSDCRQTRTNSDMVEVGFADGQSIICTPDHKILTPTGWTQAHAMRGQYGYNAVSQTVRNKSCASWLLALHVKSIWGGATIFADSIFSATECGFIERFIQTISARSLAVSLFTTRIMIDLIMRLKIWLSCSATNIRAITKMAMAEISQIRPETLLLAGMDQMQALNGINSTTKTSKIDCTEKHPGSAINAASNTIRRIARAFGFARITVNQHGDEHSVSISNHEYASDAERSFNATNISRRNIADAYALIECVSVKPSSNSDTYCMQVDESHAFAVDRGVIVHNCLRYLVASGADRMQTKPIKESEPMFFPSEFGNTYVQQN